MKPRPIAAAALAALFVSHSVFAQSTQPSGVLKVGDPAPALSVGKWLKGGPVKAIEPGKLYVVEFWATWCGPCKASIPHLSEMAKKNPDVTFIGQDVLEQDEADIEPFVKSMGDKMSYNVATDTAIGQDGDMVKNWLMAAKQDGIPTAFLVGKDGKIAWIGHPMELEPILEKVKAGTYDTKGEAAKAAKETEINAKLQAAMKAKDYDAALKAGDEMAAVKPELADRINVFQLNLLTRAGRTAEATAKAEAISAGSKDLQALNAVAWMLATKKSPTEAELKIARTAADKANTISGNKEPALLDTSARVYAMSKSWDKAVETETQAVGLAEGQMKADLQKSLDAYKKQELPAKAE